MAGDNGINGLMGETSYVSYVNPSSEFYHQYESAFNYIYSHPRPPPPPIPPISGLTKNRRYSEIGGTRKSAVLGVIYITYKTLIWDLEMGGGIGGEAVLGGGGIGGTSDDYTRPRLIPYTPVE